MSSFRHLSLSAPTSSATMYRNNLSRSLAPSDISLVRLSGGLACTQGKGERNKCFPLLTMSNRIYFPPVMISLYPLCCWWLHLPFIQNDAKHLKMAETLAYGMGTHLKMAETLAYGMGTHLRVFSESYPINTNIIGFRWFLKIFRSVCLRSNMPQY